jgi:transposase-like protein
MRADVGVVVASNDEQLVPIFQQFAGGYGQPRKIVTDGLCSYSAAMKELGNADRLEVGGRLNNRAENSHAVSTT